MRKLLLTTLTGIFLISTTLSAQTWITQYVSFDDAVNGTGDQTSSVAVFGANNFVALVSGTPPGDDIFNVDGNYLVGYMAADSGNGRTAFQEYSPSSQFEVWSSTLDQVTVSGAWQIAGGKNNYVYVANKDANHNILVFELTPFGVVSTDFRMETGTTELIFAIEVDTAGYVYVVDYEGTDVKTNELKVFAPIGAAGTTWDQIGGHNDTPVTTIDLPAGIYQGVTVSGDGTQLFVSATSERSLWKYVGDPTSGYTKDVGFNLTLAENDTIGDGGTGTPSLLGLAYVDDPGYVFAVADSFIHIGGSGGYPYGRIYVIDGETATSTDTIDIAQWNYARTGSYSTGSSNGRAGGFTSVMDVDTDPTEPAVYTQTYYGWAVEKWIYDGILSVERKHDVIPTGFTLSQNYPNPFNPATTIEFDIGSTEHVTLSVYNLNGRLVAKLVDEELSPGVYKTTFKSADFSSGVYFYVLRAGRFTEQKKMILTK